MAEKTVEQRCYEALKARGVTFAAAESCTGGLIAKRITDVPGASGVFEFGWVTYADRAKTEMLGVPENVLKRYGAVSEPVVKAMAEGALERSGADVAVAVSGLAQTVDTLGHVQHLLHQRGLAGAAVAQQGNIANVVCSHNGVFSLQFDPAHGRCRAQYAQHDDYSSLLQV